MGILLQKGHNITGNVFSPYLYKKKLFSLPAQQQSDLTHDI